MFKSSGSELLFEVQSIKNKKQPTKIKLLCLIQ